MTFASSPTSSHLSPPQGLQNPVLCREPGSTSTVAGGLNLPWLDALRGWAIVLVALVHSSMFIMSQGALTQAFAWADFGKRGVQLFYLISAFTLMLSLDSARPQQSPLRNFYLRRFFRIAPLFYAAVLINLLFIHVTHKPAKPWAHVALGAFFLNGLHPNLINTITIGGWSVAVEVMFYAILPFLAGPLRTMTRALVAAVVTALVVYPVSVHFAQFHQSSVWQDYFLIFWLPVELPVFFLGIALYHFWKGHFMHWLQGHAPERRPLISLLLLAVSPLPLLLPRLPQLYGASVTFSFVILALCACPWALLQNRLSLLLGRVSYSMYLLHFFVIETTAHYLIRLRWHGQMAVPLLAQTHPRVAILLMALLIVGFTLPVAMLSARLIERPGMALGRRLIAALEARGVARRGAIPGVDGGLSLHGVETNSAKGVEAA